MRSVVIDADPIVSTAGGTTGLGGIASDLPFATEFTCADHGGSTFGGSTGQHDCREKRYHQVYGGLWQDGLLALYPIQFPGMIRASRDHRKATLWKLTVIVAPRGGLAGK